MRETFNLQRSIHAKMYGQSPGLLD